MDVSHVFDIVDMWSSTAAVAQAFSEVGMRVHNVHSQPWEHVHWVADSLASGTYEGLKTIGALMDVIVGCPEPCHWVRAASLAHEHAGTMVGVLVRPVYGWMWVGCNSACRQE